MKFIFTFFVVWISSVVWSQHQPDIDVKRLTARVTIVPEQEQVSGILAYEIAVKNTTDSIFFDAQNMQAKLLQATAPKTRLTLTPTKIWLTGKFKAGKTYQIDFTYTAKPKQTLYFVGWDNAGDNQVWTQGQGKYTSHWLPSLDDMTDKIEFDISYTFPKDYSLIANGKLIDTTSTQATTTWQYDMQQPMSSYLVAMAAGNYQKKQQNSTRGVPIELYYLPQDSARVEPTYRYTTTIFDFFETEIGVPYPWQNYKQIPVRDFLYAGMENTGTTIFSDSFITDSIGFIDRNYVNVNAHEMAHQWFGNFVTETNSQHHWLHEGFATYYALLAEREIFGEAYFYMKLYESAEQLREASTNGKGEALLNPEASSMTYYQKGAWALHILREKVGNEAFKKAVKTYLISHAYQNVETEDFIAAVQQASGMDLTDFVDNWLKQTAFQSQDAFTALKKSLFMQQYFQLSALRKQRLSTKKETLLHHLQDPVNDYLGQETVHQLGGNTTADAIQVYQKAFKTDNILVRQAIAVSLTQIPEILQKPYESLLADESYLTQAEALFNLWQNFPNKRHQYLDEMRGVEGFSNKNIELLWLTLHLVTQDYHPEEKSAIYQQLSGYTSPQYAYDIRENAFGFLYQIDSFTAANYRDLLQACVHPVWRFRSFARTLLTKLIENPKHKEAILKQHDQFTASQQRYLTKIIN